MRIRLLMMMLASAVAMLVCAPAALADDYDLPPDVADAVAAADSDTRIPVIIVAPGHVDQVAAAIDQTVAELPLVGAVAAALTADQLRDLRDSALADSIEDIQVDDTIVGLGWSDYLSYTNCAIGLGDVLPPAQDGPSGAGVNVAVLDSGISAHPDLIGARGSRIVAFKDFVNGKRRPYDDAGHGTFVAGLIAGDGGSSLPLSEDGEAIRQYRGAAPAAGIVALKVLNARGEGRESDVIKAIAWAIRNRVRYNIEVLNISLGAPVMAPTRFDPMAYAVEAAWQAGITVVTAAGNDGEFGPGGILSPANDPYVITVGAMDTRQTADPDDDIICEYSSVGPTLFDEFAKPDVIAPGNRNISLRVAGSFVDGEWPDNRIPVSQYIPGASVNAVPAYYMLSGTSTAAPVVSGVVAAMLGEDPTLNPDDVKLRLMATARPMAGVSVLQQGAGLVDAAGALRASSLWADGPTLSEDLGDGTTILSRDRYKQFGHYAWSKFKWTKFKWVKFKWTKFKWVKFKWTEVDWAKFKWTEVDWAKFKWTKFKWTGTEWTKFKWTGVDWLKFKWATYDWLKFKWATLIEGQ